MPQRVFPSILRLIIYILHHTCHSFWAPAPVVGVTSNIIEVSNVECYSTRLVCSDFIMLLLDLFFILF